MRDALGMAGSVTAITVITRWGHTLMGRVEGEQLRGCVPVGEREWRMARAERTFVQKGRAG